MKCSGFGILIPFSKSVALSKIARLLFATTFASHYSISIRLRYAFTIVYTYVACCTFICIFVNSCSFYITTFSSLASIYTICASTKWCSSTSSSSDSSMHIGFIDVVFGPVFFFACQHCLLLCKNSIAYVLVASMSNYRLPKLYFHIIRLPFYTF
jgi:hypothetical protein